MAGTRRQREIERQRWERQQQRRAARAARRRKRYTVIASVMSVAIVLVAAVWLGVSLTGKNDHNAAASSTPDSCAYSAVGGEQTGGKNPGLPPSTPVTGTWTADLALSSSAASGTVTITLQTDAAPCTSNSFVHLVQKKFFDGTTCHRLTSGGLSVLQCGDPTGTGSGGPGYQFGEENLPRPETPAAAASPGAATSAPAATTAIYPAGTVAMANAGAGTNGSQFFIVYKDSQLPPDYSVFGAITSGMTVIDKIAAAGISGGGTDGAPKNPVTIKSAMVKEG